LQRGEAAPGGADGGDFIWLDGHTVLAGHSCRTNVEGMREIAQILAAEDVSLERVDLPHDRGPGHVLHLMSLISPVADDLAVVYPPLAPIALIETLRRARDPGHSCRRRRVPDDGCNVLAVEPRRVVMVAGNPRTRAALESDGCEVHEYDARRSPSRGDGGPTCLTAPIWRDGGS
jgi:N-dimethylarginine dimethylaminohydrolase